MDTEILASPDRLKTEKSLDIDTAGKGFFQLVRQLHAEKVDEGNRFCRPVGKDFAPENELVRFRATRSLSYPSAEVSMVEFETSGDKRTNLEVSFMGLTGPTGVLPDHYSELVIEQHRERNEALRDFFDIFNHRSISFFYRAWSKYRLVLNAEMSGGMNHKIDPVTQSISSLMGIDLDRLKNVANLDGRSLLYFAGHFIAQTRNSSSFSSLLTDYLGMPVEVKQFCGEWLDMEVDDRVQLPNVFGQAQNNVLGQDFVIGEKVFCVENRFEVIVGPMRRGEAENIRPGSQRQKSLCALIDLYAGPTYQYDIRYLLRGGYRPKWQTDERQSGMSLGWNTWLPQQGQSPEQDDILITYSVLRH